MRFVTFTTGTAKGVAVKAADGRYHGYLENDVRYPGSLLDLVRSGAETMARAGAELMLAPTIDSSAMQLLPPLETSEKILCVGLNYRDHSAESGFESPDYPVLFARFASSLIGHAAPMIRPIASEQLDFEGELAAIIGKGGRYISEEDALKHICGYSVFNDGSVRDFQSRSPQWTIGKNFDGTGAFGPELVTADELPAGCAGLRIETRLNGVTMQQASTDDMIFSVAKLVSIISEAITLSPGDVIVTGTPAGVGLARKPPLWMKDGDICEVEVEKVGLLVSPIRNEQGVDAQTAEPLPVGA